MSDLTQCLRVIQAQQAADIAYDLLRAGQQHPDYLRDTLDSIDRDCVQAFLQQLSKRIAHA